MRAGKRMWAICAAAAVLLTALGGCGSTQGGPEPSDGTGGKAFVPAFTGLPGEVNAFTACCIGGDSVYFVANGTMTSTGTVSGVFGSSSFTTSSSGGGTELSLYRTASDSSGCTKLPNYTPMTLPEGSEGMVDLPQLCADPEGNLWVAESAMVYNFDPPEDSSDSGGVTRQYIHDSGRRLAIRKLDPTGAELLSIDLAEVVDNLNAAYINGLICDASGNLYFCCGNRVYAFDKNGAALFTLESPTWVASLIVTSDGAAAAAGYEGTGLAVKPIDAAAKSWGNSIPLEMSIVYPGGGEYYFYYTLGSSLYGYKKDTSESVRLLGWLDCDIDQDTVRALGLQSDGSFLCAAYSGENGGELIRLTEQDISALPRKTVLRLATMGLDYTLRKQILRFNRQSERYRIEVQDYSEFNTREDQTAGVTKMSAEIIAGRVPDIFDVSRLPVGQYVSKGVLEDLYPYIDADPELSREDLMGSVIKALERNGGLYQVSPAFGILSLVGRADVVGEEMGWTLDDMNAVLARQPAGTQLLDQYITKSDILYYLCAMNMNRYMDWNKGVCSFDSEDFKKMLAFCDTFPSEVDINDPSYGDEVSGVQSGKKLLTVTDLSNFMAIQMYEAMFGGPVTYKGFPREDGVGNIVYVSTGLGMSAACKDKDGAWSFLRTLLTEEYQMSDDIWAFPIHRAAFDRKLEEAMEKETVTDENGNEVEVTKGGVGIDGFFVELYALTQEQADQILAVIESADSAIVFDESVMNIVKEEAAAYFAGEKTVEETAALIQNRVRLYISEQK